MAGSRQTYSVVWRCRVGSWRAAWPPAAEASTGGGPATAKPLTAWAHEARAQCAITLPLALTLLTRFAQGFIDLAIVGRLLGAAPLAGVSLALTLQFTTLGVVTAGFGDAVATLCSQARGAGRPALPQRPRLS